LPDLSVAIEASLASGDMAAASFVYTGTHRGDYFGVPPTENPCASRPAIFSAFATARSQNIGAWATSPARSLN
jgi:predicted ester cyclase